MRSCNGVYWIAGYFGGLATPRKNGAVGRALISADHYFGAAIGSDDFFDLGEITFKKALFMTQYGNCPLRTHGS